MGAELRKATWLELFYDLVFVVAIAKAVHALGHLHHGQIAADSYLKYVLIMVPLWWAWTGHTLFANRFDTDDAPQRLLTLAQMACAASMAAFVDPDFDPNFRGFLLSYAAFRGLLVGMYWRVALTANPGRAVASYLGSGFALGLFISLSSLCFDGFSRYLVLYLGISVDMLIPLFGRQRLRRHPVESHHLPERYGLLTLILLGESVASLVATVDGVDASARAVSAAIAGFVLTVAIWWTYYENLEHRIYGRSLGTGQAVIYLHLVIYIALGGIANTLRFAIDPALSLADYKLLAGVSAWGCLVALQLLQLAYHPREERGRLMRNAALMSFVLIAALAVATTHLLVVLALTSIFVGAAASDALRRRSLRRRATLSPANP